MSEMFLSLMSLRFTLKGMNLLLIFPFRIDLLSEGAQCTEIQKESCLPLET